MKFIESEILGLRGDIPLC